MSVRLSPADFQRLVAVVQQLPGFQTTVYERQRWLDNAFAGDSHHLALMGLINLDGLPLGAAVETVKRLADFGAVAYGKEALGVFVNAILPFVGNEERDFLAGLFARYSLDEPVTPLRPLGHWRGVDSPAAAREKIIGENTLRDVRVLELALAATPAVVLLKIATNAGGHAGSGFMIASDLLMTNHHVIGNRDEAERATVVFNYQLDRQGREGQTQAARALAGGLFYSNADLDYTVMQIQEVPAFGQPLTLKNSLVARDARVAIIQHPGGHLKKISMQNNKVAFADQRVVQYYTSTLPGSSGSPVFNDDFEVVAIHHSGGMLQEPGTNTLVLRNEGTSMMAVRADLAAHAPAIAARLAD